MITKPLAQFLGWIFEGVYQLTDNYGVSLIILSIIVNIILIPVYYPIEKLKKRNKEKQKDMDAELEEIKEVYKGQERFYYVSALHRQYRYNPLRSLVPSLGLLIQIPFFMAAYYMLSHYNGYAGHSFLFISNLSIPDGSIDLGYSALNLLPVIMTILNIISSLLYTKGAEKKERYQLWGLAALFLVVLYNSPAALVLYWTMNNVFALVKQAFEHRKVLNKTSIALSNWNLKKILPHIYYGLLLWTIFIAVSTFTYNDTSTMTPIYFFTTVFILLFVLEGIGFIYFIGGFRRRWHHWITLGLFTLLLLVQVKLAVPMFEDLLIYKELNIKPGFKLGLIQGLGFLCTLPYFIKATGTPKLWRKTPEKNNPVLFILISLFLTSLTLLWIPIQVYSSMPSRFGFSVFSIILYNGIPFIIALFLLIAVYFIMSKKYRSVAEVVFTFIGLTAFIYTFFIQFNFGSLDGFILTRPDGLLGKYPLYIVEFIFLVSLFVIVKKIFEKKAALFLILFGVLNVLALSQALITAIPLQINRHQQLAGDSTDHSPDIENVLSFSKDKENVVVFMLDMFHGTYIDPIVNKEPELKSVYSGFTWFPNTLANSYFTNASLPGIMSGTDYTPQSLNSMEGETLMDKISRSYEFMTQKAQSRGYDVSIVNPYYYRSAKGDMSALSSLNVNVAGNSQFRNFYDNNISEKKVDEHASRVSQSRLLAAVGIFRSVPYNLKARVYNKGNWFNLEKSNYRYVAENVSFIRSIPLLANTSSEVSTFKFFNSEITHTPFAISEDGEILQSGQVDESVPNSVDGLNSFYSSYWTMKWIGDFINWLKVNDIYDNTKIILVSDHGNIFNHPYMIDFENPERAEELGSNIKQIGRLNPLLLVKDFNTDGDLKVDQRFMSNVDTHDIAFGDNMPHTGEADENRILYSSVSNKWATRELFTTDKFEMKHFFKVTGSIYDLENWENNSGL